MRAYSQLEARFRRLGAVEEAIAVLHWDAAAMMPSGGGEARAEQLATLRLIAHEQLTAAEIGGLLAAAEAESASLDQWQFANLREMRRRWRHATAVPGGLVEALSRACSRSEAVWREARPADDFAAALPGLKEVLSLTREVAAAKAQALGTALYEALLDQYEPGASTATIDGLFGEIEAFLPPLLGQSAHPFCGGTPDDVRLTTRYDEADFSPALMGVLHETGHRLYERGLPPEWLRQPVGEARGMAMHESQSLFLEMQVCRGPAFAAFTAPILRECFGGAGDAWEPEAVYRRQIRVQPGPIRFDADEVTYPAHVILRHRLERAMLAGDLLPRDLPGAWAEGLRRAIGITPPSDREGCLQDIHWYDGAWAYFPTYTMGALIAAQLFATARRAVPELLQTIERGEFRPLLDWLRTHIHAKASLLSTAELVEAATGAPLGAAAFERHLRDRYLE